MSFVLTPWLIDNFRKTRFGEHSEVHWNWWARGSWEEEEEDVEFDDEFDDEEEMEEEDGLGQEEEADTESPHDEL